MSSDLATGVAIRIEDLAKRYRIGTRERYSTLRDRIAGAVTTPFRRLRSGLAGHSTILSQQSVWALGGIDLGIQAGEVVGVIGRNGAGKTTLLKVLSRITEPTRGRVEIHGRVASLLEVGTGFHPELSGRDNIFLNGAILGMGRAEIEHKFDEIVTFAEVERFIDTQVKHYSSGMYLRLAFAVAAHLEPEILLVDEVLAVGDAAFQRRCLGKMREVSRSGRTVLFVSHNLEAIHRLCDRCIWLDGGHVVEDGTPQRVVAAYLKQSAEDLRSRYEAEDESGDAAILLEAEFLDSRGRPSPHVEFGEPFTLRMVWEHRQPIPGAFHFLRIFDAQGRFLFAVNPQGTDIDVEAAGRHEVQVHFEHNVLVPGQYSLGLGCFVMPKTYVHRVEDALGLQVLEVPHDGRVLNVPESSLFAPQPRWTHQVSLATAAPEQR